jgi:hypothetical protein
MCEDVLHVSLGNRSVLLWRMEQLKEAQTITADDIRARIEVPAAQRAILDAMNRMIASKWWLNR